MACHKRVTYYFVLFFSIVALALLFLEVVPPTMLKDGDGEEYRCYGIVFDCSKCPGFVAIGSTHCDYTLKPGGSLSDNVLLSAALSIISGAIITIMTLVALILGFVICCSHSSWPRFISRFVVAYIVLDVIALAANIAAMALWTQMESSDYMISFYFGWAANAILLLLFIMMITLRCCELRGRSEDEDETDTTSSQ